MKLSLSVVLNPPPRQDCGQQQRAGRRKKFQTWLFRSLLGSFFKIGMFVLMSTSGEILEVRLPPHPHDARF